MEWHVVVLMQTPSPSPPITFAFLVWCDMQDHCWCSKMICGPIPPLFLVRCGSSKILRAYQGCVRREGTSEAAPEAIRQAVGEGSRSGWGRLLSVTNAIEAGTWRQGDSGWA